MSTATLAHYRPATHHDLARQHGLTPTCLQGPRRTVYSGRATGRVSVPRGFRPLGGGMWASDTAQAVIDLSTAGWIQIIGFVKPGAYREVVAAVVAAVARDPRHETPARWATLAAAGMA